VLKPWASRVRPYRVPHLELASLSDATINVDLGLSRFPRCDSYRTRIRGHGPVFFAMTMHHTSLT
jgi:hypothetical protein